jgi:Ca2+-binding EF-hand superfamily protein
MRNMTTIALTMIFMASLTTASMAADKGDGESKGCKSYATCKGGVSGFAKMTEKFDKDGDGKLSAEEKTAAKAEFKEKMAVHKAKFMANLDANGADALSEEDMAAMKDAAMEMMAGHKAKFMEKFDKDGDGELSEEEKTAAKAARKEKMAERKAKFMEKFDKDGDGTLSQEEKAAIRKSGMGHRKGGRRHGKSEESTADSLVR